MTDTKEPTREDVLAADRENYAALKRTFFRRVRKEANAAAEARAQARREDRDNRMKDRNR